MYLLYADSSGRTEIRSGRYNSPYITVGVIVHEKDWRSTESRISAVKREMFPELDPRGWELHAYDIWNSRNFFADRRLGMNLKKKLEIFSKIIDLSCRLDITVVGVTMFKDKMVGVYTSPTVTSYSWLFVVERFEHFLAQKPTGTNNGLLLIDASQKIPELEIRRALRNAIKMGGIRHRIDHIIEDPIFVESDTHNLIQLADMVAYVLLKHYKGDSKFEEWFGLLKSKMYRSGDGPDIFGLKEFP